VLKTFAPGVKAVVVYPPASAPSPSDSNAVLPQEVRPPFFLSLNRFERKKDIPLALNAFSKFKAKNLYTLVVAGGYDERVAENKEHHQELVSLAKKLDISGRVTFLRSVSDSTRQALLRSAVAVIYTPSGEHFGIVPCEAMAVGTPVVACADGGPKESVLDGQTGYLCQAGDSSAFAKAMETVAGLSDMQRRKMGDEGRKRVREFFSQASFVKQLDQIIRG
jgi:alpha-1,3/alpha-1,6-mannosyltransferase